MEQKDKLNIFVLCLLVMVMVLGVISCAPSKTEKKHTVIVILDAKPGKEAELRSALEAVVEPSRSEGTCLEYRLHTSIENPAQFVLYETWENQEKHKLQFEKPYIKALGDKLGALLAKPYQVIFAEEMRV